MEKNYVEKLNEVISSVNENKRKTDSISLNYINRDCTDIDMASRLHSRACNELVISKNSILTWNGSVYSENHRAALHLAFCTAIKLQYEINILLAELKKCDPDDKFKQSKINRMIQTRNKSMNKYRNLKAADELLKTYKGQNESISHKLDTHSELINMANGTYDVKTGEFRAHRQADLLTQISPVSYDPNAECPNFKKFIRDICLEDNDLAEYLQIAVGYSLTGFNTEQVMFFIFGDGSNGKSVLTNILSKLCGKDYSASTAIETLTEVKQRGIQTDIPRLENKRFVIASENNKGVALDEARVKILTGGEAVLGRELYGQDQEVEIIAKFWFMTNEFPEIRGKTHGIIRRIEVIPFNASFKDPHEMSEGDKPKDPNLKDKLAMELPGIMNWALEGARKWIRNGSLPKCRAVEEAKRKYAKKMDSVQLFLTERTETKGGYRVQAIDLHNSYVTYCNTVGIKALNIKSFKSQMEIKGYQSLKSSGVMQWKNIKLLASLVQSKAS